MSRRIAFLIPTLSNGGAEKVISNLSLNLSHEYDKIILLYDSKQIDYQYDGEIVDLNINQIDTNKTIFEKLIIKLYNTITSTRKVKKIKKMYGIQTTVSFLTDSNILNIFSKLNDKLIISVRNYNSKLLSGFDGKIYSVLIKLFYNRADAIVAVSKGVEKDLVDNFKIDPDKIKVIYNPYEISKIQEMMNESIEVEYRDLFNSPVIINVARLVEQKGQKHLIKAFSQVKEEIVDAKLVILGKGELEDDLRTMAKEYKLENDIFFIGFQKNPFKFIKKSSVFVLSSYNEGFPNTLVEAMSCGTPVISTDCKSGPREILAPDTDINFETESIEYSRYGILTPVFDKCKFNKNDLLTENEKLLASSLVELLKNNKLREDYALLALQRAQDFEIKNIMSQWEGIL
ncbi:glycosyl transferase group 1 [Methanohalobium evestigatum Z-7303]|uniref:Glycosyl transferase group 1 n=1 Tax=Methanohalobium evestigatum (strain ATCC BAA-1072 / DSM 3721 / NBRC 107634 / OCM 161 / Z-7303) TaxID=644295 RepID=D7E7P7_METEZ|nr:glycosyltransferase [Methanohalobium evestigatum]ADI74120.1 glycosyl transferase group 1 [Methanohalobium evestigatum Z-7303]